MQLTRHEVSTIRTALHTERRAGEIAESRMAELEDWLASLQVVQGAKRDQPTGLGDSPSVREPPPVEASPSHREVSGSAVGAKRPLDLLSAVSVLTSGMDSDDEHGKCGHCTRTRCWCQ